MIIIDLQKGRCPTKPGHYYLKPQGGVVFPVEVRQATGNELWNNERYVGLVIGCTPLGQFYHPNGQWSERLEFRGGVA